MAAGFHKFSSFFDWVNYISVARRSSKPRSLLKILMHVSNFKVVVLFSYCGWKKEKIQSLSARKIAYIFRKISDLKIEFSNFKIRNQTFNLQNQTFKFGNQLILKKSMVISHELS